MFHLAILTQLVIGALLGVFGYRLFRLLVVAVGALVGLTAGVQVADGCSGTWALFVLPAIGVFLGIVLLGWSVLVTLFLFGALTGWTLAVGVSLMLGLNGPIMGWMTAIVAVVVGTLALVYRRPLIVIGTALCGAQLMTEALFWLVSGRPAMSSTHGGYPLLLWPGFDSVYFTIVNIWLFFAVWFFLFVLFVVLQGHLCKDIGKVGVSGKHFEKERK
jgi:hypothetical protein